MKQMLWLKRRYGTLEKKMLGVLKHRFTFKGRLMIKSVEQKAKEEVFVPFVKDFTTILMMRANLQATHSAIAFVQRKFRL